MIAFVSCRRSWNVAPFVLAPPNGISNIHHVDLPRSPTGVFQPPMQDYGISLCRLHLSLGNTAPKCPNFFEAVADSSPSHTPIENQLRTVSKSVTNSDDKRAELVSYLPY
eukprot:gb/GECG01011330.1/.p1 GENE.gb/GECG01011330.1/~~gb/GECG01011330.1/.p1  ORF type:complete len:110 (+),score=3.51 gb/GECG01011330.1/:1-330(+)